MEACTAEFVHSHGTGEEAEAHRRGRSLSTEQAVGQDQNPDLRPHCVAPNHSATWLTTPSKHGGSLPR